MESRQLRGNALKCIAPKLVQVLYRNSVTVYLFLYDMYRIGTHLHVVKRCSTINSSVSAFTLEMLRENYTCSASSRMSRIFSLSSVIASISSNTISWRRVTKTTWFSVMETLMEVTWLPDGYTSIFRNRRYNWLPPSLYKHYPNALC